MLFSVAIIAQDEEDRISECLKAVSFADEVVVVDSGSRDNTVEIARSFGCRVLSEEWRGYAKQKQFAVDNCSNDWVLILDADERVPLDTARWIMEALESVQADYAGFSFSRKNFFHGRWFRYCGWWPDRVLRLVDRRQGNFSNHLVHEAWICRGRTKELQLCLEHYSFRGYSDLIAKLEAYSTLSSREMLENGKEAGVLSPLTHGCWMFFRAYILELGLLGGFDGFMISMLNAGGSFMKYAKLREARIRGRRGDLYNEAKPGKVNKS